MDLLTRKTNEKATELIDKYFYKEIELSTINDFLSEHINLSYQTDVKNENDLEIRTEQNLFIQSLLEVTDSHKLSLSNNLAGPLRRLIWKYSGINCDNFDKLDIRQGVRFDNPEGGNLRHFNPKNITILTGGQKVFLTGLRGTTYLDGSNKIIIYGPFNCASGVNIFTHDHVFDDPERTQFEQGKNYLTSIIYPSCFIGENTDIFGNLNLKTIVAGKSVTQPQIDKLNPPYSAIGGIGKIIKSFEFPQEFPPEYLANALKNVKDYSEKYGKHLENYFNIVADYLNEVQGISPEERINKWSPYQEKINKLETELLK